MNEKHRDTLNAVAKTWGLSPLNPRMDLMVYFTHVLDLMCVGVGLSNTTTIDERAKHGE